MAVVIRVEDAQQRREDVVPERGKGDRTKRGRAVWVVLAILGVVAAVLWADPGKSASSVDRIFSGAFVAFAVGLVELFLALIGLVILGKIDLPKVFQDKDGQLGVEEGADGEPLFVRAVAGKGAVSLSRLQAFLWTLAIMVIYFHKAVSDGHGELPAMPSDLLLVMGISGAVYLAGKDLATRDAKTVIVHKTDGAPAGKGAETGKLDGKAGDGAQVGGSAAPRTAEPAAGKVAGSATAATPSAADSPSDGREAGNENRPADAPGAGHAARMGLEGGLA
jgi:hypothetical protein